MPLEPIDVISGQLREAVGDPAAWETALDGINTFLDASGAILLSVDERVRHSPCSSSLMELKDDYFRSEWHIEDSRDVCCPLLLNQGIVFDHEFMTVEQIETYYDRFVSKHGLKWFAGVGIDVGGDLWCLALQRSPCKGAFDIADLPRLVAVRERLAHTARYAHIAGRQWIEGAFAAFNRGQGLDPL